MSKDLLKALMTGNKDEATTLFRASMDAKKDEALQVKKVAVATDIFNARNVKG